MKANRPPLVSVTHLPEDAQIKSMCDVAVGGKNIAIVLDNEEIAERYIAKILKLQPALKVERFKGLTPDTVLIKVHL